MADTISSNGSITFAIDGLNLLGSTTLTYYPTGSQMTATIQNVAMGSWQGMDTSSLSDIRYAYVKNNGSGSVQVATDSGGTKVAAILQTNDWAFLPWSGSTGLYARAYTSASSITTIVVAG